MHYQFSTKTHNALRTALQIAKDTQSGCVSSAHFFLGILQQSDEEDFIGQLLQISGVSSQEARLYAQSALESEPDEYGEFKLTRSAKRVQELAQVEATHFGRGSIEIEHLFIACLRPQRGPHVGEVLRPLGLDPVKVREHLHHLKRSETPYQTGSPLNILSKSSKDAIEAAHEVMRSSFCGHISTIHLLLGLLTDPDSVAVETLLVARVDIEELKQKAWVQILSDGHIAAPQKKFTPAAKRALERAKAEAQKCENSYIGPQHLLYALLPHGESIAERVGFGSSIDDPLEKVWTHFPAHNIQQQYEKMWRSSPDIEPDIPVTRPPSNWIKVDAKWAWAGVLWWLWIFAGDVGTAAIFSCFGLSLLLAIRAEIMRNLRIRDLFASFCYGECIGFSLFLLFMTFFRNL